MPVSSRLAIPASVLFFTVLLGGVALAQGTPQRLIGGTVGNPVTLQQQAWCNPGAMLCPLPYGPVAVFAGGTAYNSFNQVVWDSNGPLLIGVSATSVPPCTVVCGPIPVPGLPGGVLVTGMALDNLGQTLITIDTQPAIRTFVVPPVGCPLPAFMCALGPVIPPGLQAGGLAFSEKNRLLYFSASNFAGGLPNSVIQVSNAGNPCVPMCPFGVPPCPNGAQMGPITGMAWDDATDDLYLTDGVTVMRLTMNLAISPCTIQAVACCQQALPAPYYGLELEPSHPVPFGVSCTGAPCPACPGMTLTTVADPTVGNPMFAFNLNGGPVPSTAVTLLGFPGCTPGLPVFCGRVYPPLAATITLPGVVLAGVPPCGGAATMPLPLPLNYSLSGLSFCAQTIVVCQGLGVGLSNAINATITDN